MNNHVTSYIVRDVATQYLKINQQSNITLTLTMVSIVNKQMTTNWCALRSSKKKNEEENMKG